LKHFNKKKIMCCRGQHPPTWGKRHMAQAAHDWGLITTKYKEKTIKHPPAGESQDRPRPWKRGVFKEQT